MRLGLALALVLATGAAACQAKPGPCSSNTRSLKVGEAATVSIQLLGPTNRGHFNFQTLDADGGIWGPGYRGTAQTDLDALAKVTGGAGTFRASFVKTDASTATIRLGDVSLHVARLGCD